MLKIKLSDVSDRTITLREPKSGKETERAYMPENMSKKLAEYINEKSLQGENRIFPICYSTARSLIKGLGAKLHVYVSSHDLRRYSATYASRNGVPLEVVSKVILRHQDLKQLRFISARSAILRRSGEWTIFTGNRTVQHNQLERGGFWVRKS